MRQFDVPALSTAFDELAGSRLDGIPGIWVVHSGFPGPMIGITIMTHGNEPCGLGAYRYFRYQNWLQLHLRRGSVYFVLNNIEAARKYFEAVGSGDAEAKLRARFVDVNMNRLPEDVYALTEDERYEIRRAQELRPIWDRFNYALDIHSTAQNTAPMIVALERSSLETVAAFPITTVLSNIDAVQKGRPATYFYGKGQAPVYGVEMGSHEKDETFWLAITCITSFLRSIGSIPSEVPMHAVSHTEYQIFDSVWFPNDSYRLTDIVPTFTNVVHGQILARGDGDPIVSRHDAVAIMGPLTTKPVSIEEEVLFLAHRLEHPAGEKR